MRFLGTWRSLCRYLPSLFSNRSSRFLTCRSSGLLYFYWVSFAGRYRVSILRESLRIFAIRSPSLHLFNLNYDLFARSWRLGDSRLSFVRRFILIFFVLRLLFSRFLHIRVLIFASFAVFRLNLQNFSLFLTGNSWFVLVRCSIFFLSIVFLLILTFWIIFFIWIICLLISWLLHHRVFFFSIVTYGTRLLFLWCLSSWLDSSTVNIFEILVEVTAEHLWLFDRYFKLVSQSWLQKSVHILRMGLNELVFCN